MKLRNSAITIATALCVVASPASAQEMRVIDPAPYLMEEAAEIALSRSAAPEAISGDASVLVLESDGSYRTAAEGTNGWTCFTGRAWTGPARFVDGKRVWSANNFATNIRAPQCFNAAATPAMLKIHRIATWHILNGATTDEVDLAIGNAMTSGVVAPPEPGAMSYMFSPQQVLTPDGGRFHPHVMLYQPHVTQESYGAGSPMQGVPLVTEGGSPFATTVMLSPFWSDGTPAR